jgi:hypothetical protein
VIGKVVDAWNRMRLVQLANKVGYPNESKGETNETRAYQHRMKEEVARQMDEFKSNHPDLYPEGEAQGKAKPDTLKDNERDKQWEMLSCCLASSPF